MTDCPRGGRERFEKDPNENKDANEKNRDSGMVSDGSMRGTMCGSHDSWDFCKRIHDIFGK